MEHVVRTIAGVELQTSSLLNIPYRVREFSTLNEKFGVHEDVGISDQELPNLAYMAVGNGAHRNIDGKDGIPIIERVPHRPENLALYNHLPFVLRLPQEDLAAEERIKYRMRAQLDVNGVTYIAYYLKTLDLSETQPRLELKEVRDGVVVSQEYQYSRDNLNPVKPRLTPNQVLTTAGDYISATAKIPYELTVSDIDELLNVANIIYGSESYAIISEIALCTGVDRSVTGDFNGTTMGYVESIATQVYSIINSFNLLQSNNGGVRGYFDIGSVEPLLVIQDRTNP